MKCQNFLFRFLYKKNSQNRSGNLLFWPSETVGQVSEVLKNCTVTWLLCSFWAFCGFYFAPKCTFATSKIGSAWKKVIWLFFTRSLLFKTGRRPMKLKNAQVAVCQQNNKLSQNGRFFSQKNISWIPCDSERRSDPFFGLFCKEFLPPLRFAILHFVTF